eukprot:CAMPEP_0178370392 /NCGR_PEP_ID=MMETSP0689_2-20121128/278_1 /TAXON_ID=160604 /ORGANISM="Amphidinium massartii, Strain CS-259" /LENGTH=68 /DNA_ID=CAMNT_0019990211 /DNA_START=641 /DNA_END=847 /DNA_ORIENTATION=+
MLCKLLEDAKQVRAVEAIPIGSGPPEGWESLLQILNLRKEAGVVRVLLTQDRDRDDWPQQGFRFHGCP